MEIFFVTGTSDTIKLTGAGVVAWSAPLPGRAIVANTTYVYVTGFSDTDIATAQLENLAGQDFWRQTFRRSKTPPLHRRTPPVKATVPT